MHRVFGVLPIHSRRGAKNNGAPAQTLMPPVTRHRHLLDPRTLREALAMRRDDPSAVPIAGCTDVYVSLNFGTVKQTRFINLWRLRELRGIERRDGRLR